MNELHLFAGAGGGILGGMLLGHVPVCAVELEEYPRRVLLQRQRDGILPWFPIWDDVRTFDGTPWRGRVQIVLGGFPCQDISAAGKGEGITGERSGLWKEMARIIDEIRPQYVLVENSPMLTSRGLGTVLGDLASLGFNAEWGVLGADDAGAPHIRKRIWILAHTESLGWGEVLGDVDPAEGSGTFTGHPALGCEDMADSDRGSGPLQVGRERGSCQAPNHGHTERIEWLPEPPVGRLAHGVAHRVDQIRALGNGQVPSVAAMAFNMLVRRVSEAG